MYMFTWYRNLISPPTSPSLSSWPPHARHLPQSPQLKYPQHLPLPPQHAHDPHHEYFSPRDACWVLRRVGLHRCRVPRGCQVSVPRTMPRFRYIYIYIYILVNRKTYSITRGTLLVPRNMQLFRCILIQIENCIVIQGTCLSREPCHCVDGVPFWKY